MAMAIILGFSNNKTLEVKNYTSINLNRNGRQLDINVTNTNNDLSLNAVYDRIIELQGSYDTFGVTVEAGESKAEFSGIEANYYNSGDVEVLHLATKHEAIC